MSTEQLSLVRASAIAGGMTVSPKGIRLVTYRQISDGSWVGCWFAAEKSMKAAQQRLAGCSLAGITAEIWKNGSPVT